MRNFMPNIPIVNIKTNPLDILLTALGLRLSMLAKSNDDAFASLIQDKQVVLQFVSDDGVARFFQFNQGYITQNEGISEHANLTIHFANSMQGAKLLVKADTVSLIKALQDGKIRTKGDYKLILWFVSLVRHATKISPKYQPYVQKAKPYWQKVINSLAQTGLFGKKKH